MGASKNPYLTREAAVSKAGGGLTVYLMEELGDARLNCQHLKQAIADAQKMVAQSSHRDHFYEVAGHIIEAIPKYLLKLEKSLDATALAASRLDYEETKVTLRPSKVEELERVLQDVRVHALPRTSGAELTPKEAAAKLEAIADSIDGGSTVESALLAVWDLATQIPGRTLSASDLKNIAPMIRQAALEVEFGTNPKPSQVIARLREIVAAILPLDTPLILATLLVGNSREKVMEGFKAANPNLSEEQLEEIADHWERNKDVVKDRHSTSALIIEKVERRLATLRSLMRQVDDNLQETKSARTASLEQAAMESLNETILAFEADRAELQGQYEELREASEAWDLDYLMSKRIISKVLVDKLAEEVKTEESPYGVKLASQPVDLTEDLPDLKSTLGSAAMTLQHAAGAIEKEPAKAMKMISAALTSLSEGMAAVGLGANTAPLRRVSSELLRLSTKF